MEKQTVATQAVPAGLSDEAAMRLALQQAGLAYAAGEVPVGAVALIAQGQVIGLGFNRSIVDHDPSSHAEIDTLRQADAFMKKYRLTGLSPTGRAQWRERECQFVEI